MVSRSETARQLLTPGEVMQLPPTDEIVMVSGVQPIRGTKARYYEDPRLKARIAKPPKSIAALTAPPDDWSRLAPITAAAAAPAARTDDDLANGGIRREPELQRHEDVAPKPARPQREFSFGDGDGGDADADAARNRRLNDQMRGAAQRASLDPGDGILL
jgi:type IV secretion system protein VirD4